MCRRASTIRKCYVVDANFYICEGENLRFLKYLDTRGLVLNELEAVGNTLASHRSGVESPFSPEFLKPFSQKKMQRSNSFTPHRTSNTNSCITIIYLHIYELIIDPHNDLLPFGLIAERVEHCTGIAEVRVPIPIQALFFLTTISFFDNECLIPWFRR